MRLILRETGIAVGAAVVAGALGAWILQQRMAAFVYGVGSTDWAVIAVSALVLSALALGTVYLAIRRVLDAAADGPVEARRGSARMSHACALRSGRRTVVSSRHTSNRRRGCSIATSCCSGRHSSSASSAIRRFTIAMTFWTAETTHSATMSGLMMMASVLPVIVLGPLTGTFVDRQRSRLRIVMTCDLLSGAVVMLLALGFLAGPDAWRPAMLFAAALLIGVCNAFFDPAVNALTPDLVPRGPDRSRQRASAVVETDHGPDRAGARRHSVRARRTAGAVPDRWRCRF